MEKKRPGLTVRRKRRIIQLKKKPPRFKMIRTHKVLAHCHHHHPPTSHLIPFQKSLARKKKCQKFDRNFITATFVAPLCVFQARKRAWLWSNQIIQLDHPLPCFFSFDSFFFKYLFFCCKSQLIMCGVRRLDMIFCSLSAQPGAWAADGWSNEIKWQEIWRHWWVILSKKGPFQEKWVKRRNSINARMAKFHQRKLMWTMNLSGS